MVTVPAAAVINVNADRGDIHIASIKAAVTVIANHGDIDLSAITGAATAHINFPGSSITAHSMGSGIAIEGHAQDVTLSDIAGPVTLSGEFFGTHLEHINGTIHYHTSRTELQVARLDGEAEISPRSDITAEQAVGPLVLTRWKTATVMSNWYCPSMPASPCRPIPAMGTSTQTFRSPPPAAKAIRTSTER